MTEGNANDVVGYVRQRRGSAGRCHGGRGSDAQRGGGVAADERLLFAHHDTLQRGLNRHALSIGLEVESGQPRFPRHGTFEAHRLVARQLVLNCDGGSGRALALRHADGDVVDVDAGDPLPTVRRAAIGGDAGEAGDQRNQLLERVHFLNDAAQVVPHQPCVLVNSVGLCESANTLVNGLLESVALQELLKFIHLRFSYCRVAD